MKGDDTMAYNSGIEHYLLSKSVDKQWYDDLNAKKSEWTVVEEFTLTPEGDTPPMKPMGRAFDVQAGQVLRVLQPGERGNICDVMFLNSDNLEEHNHIPTIMLHEGYFCMQYSRVWSQQPWMRPLVTCIEDATDQSFLPEGYYSHQWIGHCTPEMIQIAEGRLNASSCHTNFLQAAQQRGLGEEIARIENMNVFQPATIRLHESGNLMGYADVPLQTKKGDYVDFYAERNLLVLVSLCPCGDQTASWKDVVLTTMTVQVLETGVKPQPWKPFHDWRPYFSDMVAKQD